MARISADVRPGATAAGRRRATRYDLSLRIRYAILRHGVTPIMGAGETVNLSLSGLLFRSEHRVRSGDSVVAALDWPVAAPNNEPLYLVLTGYVVRERRPLVAISIASKRLLRASELDERFDVFFARPANAQPAEERQIALIDEDAAAMSVISRILGPPRWTLKRADAEGAKWILTSGVPGIGLLITRTPELLEYVPPALPVILTVEEGDREALPDEARLPRLAVVPRSLTGAILAEVVQRICRPVEGGASGAPTNAA